MERKMLLGIKRRAEKGRSTEAAANTSSIMSIFCQLISREQRRTLMKYKGIPLLPLVATVAAAAVFVKYRSSMQAARQRLQGKSTVIPSPYGDIEYTEHGTGSDVLVIHGSGGGFDQGERLAQVVLDDQFHRITSSRFGYVRSTFHEGATWDEQAHAYANLLDHLGVQKVGVVGFSAGGPSALLFALLHPERVSSLTLISCGGAQIPAAESKQAHRQANALVWIFQRDFPYWVISWLFKRQFMTLMGVPKAVVADLSPEQCRAIGHFIDDMNPASLRYAGVVFDYTREVPGPRIAGIRVPTLVIHAQDDTIQPYRNAELFSSTIPGARLLSFPMGGHIVTFIEQAVGSAVQRHLRDNAGEPPAQVPALETEEVKGGS
jgi:pimeloyl-ACP methyl ester carboxylesterase